MGARYYAPWLTRWTACDPINTEWYNHRNGSPGRSSGRQPVEFTASSYEYCYANPVRFIDPSGEQAAPKPNDTQALPMSSKGDIGPAADNNSTQGQAQQNAIKQASQGEIHQPNAAEKAAAAWQSTHPGSKMHTGTGQNLSYKASHVDRAIQDRFNKKIEFEQAIQKNLAQRRALDPYAYDLATSPGVQAAMTLVMPEYGIALGGVQFYGGAKADNKFDMVLGGATVALGGYSLFKNANNIFSNMGQMSNKGETLGGFGIPKYYTYNSGGKSVFVTPHAMKHLEELGTNGMKLGPDYLGLLGQTHLKAVNAALDDILSQTTLRLEYMYKSGGNELMFGAPRVVGDLPALKHFKIDL